MPKTSSLLTAEKSFSFESKHFFQSTIGDTYFILASCSTKVPLFCHYFFLFPSLRRLRIQIGELNEQINMHRLILRFGHKCFNVPSNCFIISLSNLHIYLSPPYMTHTVLQRSAVSKLNTLIIHFIF